MIRPSLEELTEYVQKLKDTYKEKCPFCKKGSYEIKIENDEKILLLCDSCNGTGKQLNYKLINKKIKKYLKEYELTRK